MESSRTTRPAGSAASGALLVDQLRQLAAGGKSDVIDLGEVVVFAGEPEDGRVGMAGGGGLARAGDGGGSFEGRVQRSAEETHLLAGENGAGALGERSERWRGGGRWDFARRAS